jgi:hypothetical protein
VAEDAPAAADEATACPPPCDAPVDPAATDTEVEQEAAVSVDAAAAACAVAPEPEVEVEQPVAP